MTTVEENQGSRKLIRLNKSQKIEYFGGCKLKVDVGQKHLLTFTLNNGQEFISTFDRKIMKRMNLMGIIDDRSKNHTIIVFSSKDTCANIYNIIQNNKPSVRITDSVMEESEFQEKLFLPLVKASHTDQNLEAVIQTFLNCFDGDQLEEKLKYSCLIAEASLSIPLSSDATIDNDSKVVCNLEQPGDNDYITLNDENDGEESMGIDCTGDATSQSFVGADGHSFVNNDFDGEPTSDISDGIVSPNKNGGEADCYSFDNDDSVNASKRELHVPIRSTRLKRKILSEIQVPCDINAQRVLKQFQCNDVGLSKNLTSRQQPSPQNTETQHDSPEPQLAHPRLYNFPFKVNTVYTTTSTPRPGVCKYEVEPSFLKNAIKLKLNEFEDVEAHEKAFYYLWNTFLLQGGDNRPVGMLSLYDKLVKFTQQHSADIEKFKLKTVYLTFLLHFRNLGHLNEKQFFELSFMGTDLENKWHGANAPLQ